MGDFKDFCLDSGERDYKSFVEKLSAVCHKQNLELQNIGKDIHLITINPANKDKTLCFAAGVHGNEEAGPLGILEWLGKFKTQRKILIVPCANPHGFERDIRHSSTGNNLNRRWCEKIDEGEAKVLKKVFVNHKFDFFVSLHEDPTARHFYLYYSDKQGVPFYKKLIGIAEKYFKINKAENIRGDSAEAGAISYEQDGDDCSIEDFLYRKHGTPYVVLESPGSVPLQKRISYIVEALNFVCEVL